MSCNPTEVVQLRVCLLSRDEHVAILAPLAISMIPVCRDLCPLTLSKKLSCSSWPWRWRSRFGVTRLNTNSLILIPVSVVTQRILTEGEGIHHFVFPLSLLSPSNSHTALESNVAREPRCWLPSWNNVGHMIGLTNKATRR